MKNVRSNQLRTCILVSFEQLEEIITKRFGPHVTVNCTLEGLDIYTETETLEDDVICEYLTEYFDVEKVTSFHIDDCEIQIGVWIVYK